MKHACVIALVLACVMPAFLWPMEDSQHPALPGLLAEEGFEVAGRQSRSVRSTRASPTPSSKKTVSKSPSSSVERKGSTVHHSGPTQRSTHHAQAKTTKKVKLNRPTKPGKKDASRHHQQKKHKKTTNTKVKQSDKSSAKPHANHEKERKAEE